MRDNKLQSPQDCPADDTAEHDTPVGDIGNVSEPVSVPSDNGFALGSVETGPITRWCDRCQAHVVPIGRGRCPGCQQFMPANRESTRDQQNEKRIQQLAHQFARDYRPVGTFRQSQCSELARVTERLKHLRVGSAEYQRLVATQIQLATELESARQSPPPEPAAVEDLSLDQIKDWLESLTRRVIELQRLEAEHELRRAEIEAADAAAALRQAEEPVDGAVNTSAPDDPPACEYCEQTVSECLAMRDRPEVWRALHHNHPDEVERRRRESTAEMFEAMRRS